MAFHGTLGFTYIKRILVAPVQTCRIQNDNRKISIALLEGHVELTFHCIAHIVRSFLWIVNKTSLHVAFYVNLYACFTLCNKFGFCLSSLMGSVSHGIRMLVAPVQTSLSLSLPYKRVNASRSRINEVIVSLPYKRVYTVYTSLFRTYEDVPVAPVQTRVVNSLNVQSNTDRTDLKFAVINSPRGI